MDMSPLMPCPFCGGGAKRMTLSDEANFGGDVICCTKCDCSTRVEFGEKTGLVDAWNARVMLVRSGVTPAPAQHGMPAPDGYGETDFGYTFAGIHLEEGDKRLMTLLVTALGTDHPAIVDMTALLFRSRCLKCAALLSTEAVDIPVHNLSAAARDVLAERARQVSEEGWTPAHDDQHDDEDLTLAAIVYAESAVGYHASCPDTWPWSPKWFKPTTPRRDLVKAGALILAALERIDRAGGSDADR